MTKLELEINGTVQQVEVAPETPLLWVLRDHLRLTGTKFGCGIAQCGACTVHLDGTAIRSCVTPVAAVEGRSVTTIEGLAAEHDHPVQVAWKKLDVPQCGYCQAGQIMAAASLLKHNPKPTDAEIREGMAGNLCRCAAYDRIFKAVRMAARNTKP